MPEAVSSINPRIIDPDPDHPQNILARTFKHPKTLPGSSWPDPHHIPSVSSNYPCSIPKPFFIIPPSFLAIS